MNNTGKRLAFLLEAAGLSCDREAGRILVDSVTADSREVEPGCLFIALSGAVHNGHDYIREAIGKGCAVVLSEKEPASPLEVPVVTVPDTREALGYIAAAFYGFPAEEAVMIGITGTNGKTTSGWLLESVLKKAGCIPGVIGTVNVRFPGEERHGQLTTPGPLELQKILREMVDRGVSHVVMEVSSHALQQKRVNGLNFDLALFTNLSRDHLDYHPDMDAYFEAKKKLFSRYLKSSGTAVIHLETGFSVFGRNDELVENNSTGSRWGEKLSVFLEELNCCRIITCGIGRGEVQAVNPDYSLNGIRAKIITPEGVFYLESSLVGEFNLTNLTGVAGCGFALGLSAEGIRLGLKELKTIPGRLERLDEGPLIFIDYAHTPDALEHVLTTLRPLVEKRLIVVFG
ncbi:MAG: Mur ligase family protein, partial [Thermodesulfobacteriota bacterium]